MSARDVSEAPAVLAVLLSFLLLSELLFQKQEAIQCVTLHSVVPGEKLVGGGTEGSAALSVRRRRRRCWTVKMTAVLLSLDVKS